MNTHPSENDLALLAGGDCRRISRFFLRRHVRECRECASKVARFEILRADLSRLPLPDLDWNRLSAEMRANIRLGLEAGACVGELCPPRQWNPRLAVAFACLAFLLGAGLTMRPTAAVADNTPVLESSGAGLELRDGASSMTLLNRNGSAADQTASAQGEIRASHVESGTVTITNVSF